MKKVTTRAFAALLIAALILGGMGLYIFRLARDGDDWASFYANDSVYTAGTLNTGTVTDRHGTLLAFAGESVYGYAESETVRKACLHAVGDIGGNIGTGALSAFRAELVDYSLLTGTTGDGGEVRLTIDAELNAAAYNALDGRNGAVLVYNYETGEILCMVSTPSFDPNEGWSGDDSAGAYINRTISSTYVPGSVFKLVTLAAAIENIPDLWAQTFYCDGDLEIAPDIINCAGVHGTVGVEDAIAGSCNCAFAEIALQLGGDLIAEYAEKYGLTETHDLNGIETAAGSIVSAGEDNANVAWEGIGQYEDMINPYALLRLMGAIANGGKVVEPTLLPGESSGAVQLMNPATAAELSNLMNYTAETEYGGRNTFPGLEMHAKTGTAELGDGDSHAWFAGFITNADAPLAFVVMVERGGSGYSAARPIANTVLQKAVFG